MISPTYLGKLSGEETILSGNNSQPTYGRIYKPVVSSDELREKITQAKVGEAWKAMGEEYNRREGGFFRVVKTYEEGDQERYLTCYAYALGTFGKKLEDAVGTTMKQIQMAVSEGNIDPIVSKYFTNVTEPKDGDLVIYSLAPGQIYESSSGGRHTGSMHGGVYRVLKPTEHSPQSECIESKWGVWSIRYVFQHEVFFASTYDGSQVRFYRLKDLINAPTEVIGNPFEGRALKLVGFEKEFTAGKIYTSTGEADKIRNKIYPLMGGSDYKALGETCSKTGFLYFRTIKKYEKTDPERSFTSFGYALEFFSSELEKRMGIKPKDLREGVNKENFKLFVDNCFTNVSQPQEGDLVIYYTDEGSQGQVTHAGIYRSISPTKGCVESKWRGYGKRYVFQHDPFFIPLEDGNVVKFFRLNTN